MTNKQGERAIAARDAVSIVQRLWLPICRRSLWRDRSDVTYLGDWHAICFEPSK
jgi:hypothetical protein